MQRLVRGWLPIWKYHCPLALMSTTSVIWSPHKGVARARLRWRMMRGRRSIVCWRQCGWPRTSSMSPRILSSATNRAAKCSGLIAQKYNAGRPRGSFERSYVKLLMHWGRVQKEMNKWNGKWTNVVWMWPSRHSEIDFVGKAKEEFFTDGKKHFKYFDVLKLVEKSSKYTGGAESTASGARKRTKVSAAGHYSSSEGGPPIDLNVIDDDIFLSSPGTQSRPTGTKAAKRNAKGKATATSCPTMPLPSNPSLDKIPTLCRI